MKQYFEAFSPAQYFGCDGSDPEDGPWVDWIEGLEPRIDPEFAHFLWWHLCGALHEFAFPSNHADADAEGPGFEYQTAEEFDKAINWHVALLERLLEEPLRLLHWLWLPTRVGGRQMENKKAAARATALNQILVQIPGDDSAAQRQRVLTALQTLDRVTSPELMVRLKVGDPGSHISELRHQGNRIKTVTRAKQTDTGVPFRISMYTLEGA